MADIIINVPGTGTTGMGQPIARLLKNTCSENFRISYIEPEDSSVIIDFIPSDGDYDYLYITVPPNDSAISGRTIDITMHYISDGLPEQVDFRVCQTNNTDTLSSETKLLVRVNGSDEPISFICDSNKNVTKDTFTDAGITITDITSVRIGNCIENFSGLSGATSLTSISISNSVKEFGGVRETNLRTVAIPNNVEKLTDSAFTKDENLVSVTFEENSNLTEIGMYCFNNCKKLTSITIPKSVTKIGRNAFDYCNSLSNVTFEENSQLSSIGANAFAFNGSLTSITIPNSVNDIDIYCFRDCESLRTVYLPTGITSISNGLFEQCYNLEYVNVPVGVTSIRDAAFRKCGSSLTLICEAIIPPTLGTGVFSDTTLVSIKVPSESVSVYQSAPGWSDYASIITSI